MIFALLLAIGVLLMAVSISMMAKLYRKDTNETTSPKRTLFFAAFDFVLDVLTGVFSSLYGLFMIIFICGFLMFILSVQHFL